MTSLPVSTGRGGWAITEPSSDLIGRGLDKSPVVDQSDRSLSSQKSTELQDHADQSDPAGWLTFHLHRGGETGGETGEDR